MVKHLILLAGLMAASAQAAAGYQLDRKTIALGEAATLTLTARPGLLEKADLTQLARSFEIRNRNLGRDKTTETLTLTLYPRGSGRLDLTVPGVAGRAPTLEVTDGSADVPRVRFNVETQPASYHARQPVRLTFEVCDSGSLMWTRPPLPTREGLLLRPLGEEQQPAERDGQPCTAQRWHWALTATAAGPATLTLPMLEATQLGRRLRFPPPPVRLQAQSIPAWLPAEAAIGKPAVTAPPLPAEWPIERSLAWRIEVDGGYSADALKTLLALQLAADPQLTAYPPTVEAIAGEKAVPRHAVTLYMLPRERGPTQLPELIFPWYDPATGTLAHVRHAGVALEIIDPAWRLAMQALTLLAALGAIVALAYLAYRTQGWRWRRRVAMRDITQATDVADLARRLRGVDLAAGVSPAPTLGAWRTRIGQQARSGELADLVEALERANYGNAPTRLEEMKARARQVIGGLKPR